MPAISVIIPSYNHARYIEEAITSVLQQSFIDFELIIIDDCSQDQSWQLIQNFNDSRIISIQHVQNQGAAPTINEGLQLAKGEYLTILNSDDSYHPDRLEKLYAIKKDFIATDIYLYDEHSNNKKSFETDWINWFENLKDDYKKTNNFLTTLLKGNFLITTSNFFFSQALYQQLKGFKDLRYVHDYEFAIAALFSDFQVAYCQEKLLNYRLHDSNTIREAPLKAIQENVDLLHTLLKRFAEKFTKDPAYLLSITQHLNNLHQYANSEWRTEIHHKLIAKEQELFPLIEDRDLWISDRDDWIKNRDILIAERNSTIQECDSFIAEKDSTIQEQQRWIQDRDNWIDERDNWIDERDQIIQAQHKEINALRNSNSYRLGKSILLPLQPLKKIIKGEEYA